MLISPVGLKVYVCIEPVDMRKGFYSLCGLTREVLHEDPVSGAVFVFMNKRADYLKALYWCGDGFCIWSKRLEHGTFDRLRGADADSRKRSLTLSEFTLLVSGVKISKIKIPVARRKPHKQQLPAH